MWKHVLGVGESVEDMWKHVLVWSGKVFAQCVPKDVGYNFGLKGDVIL